MYIRGDHVELVVGGRLDVRSAADARSVLHTAVDDGIGDLVLDLSELDSWDATGLGVIMGAHRRAGRCGQPARAAACAAPDAAPARRHQAAPDPGHRGWHRRRVPAARLSRASETEGRAHGRELTVEPEGLTPEGCEPVIPAGTADNPHETVTSRAARDLPAS